jgi:hypothetical protein
LNKGLTCATFNWSGKMDVSIDLLIKVVFGPVTTGSGHYSDSPLFRQPIAPTAHFSDNPLFRQKWSKVV